MNNQDIFVSYELAKELKELGFDEECLGFYNHNSQLMRYMNPDKDWNSLSSQVLKNSKITIPDTYSAPTWEQAFSFIRKKYSYNYSIEYDNELNKYIFKYVYMNNSYQFNEYLYDTHEQAKENCLKKLIEIVKNDTTN